MESGRPSSEALGDGGRQVGPLERGQWGQH